MMIANIKEDTALIRASEEANAHGFVTELS